MWQLGHKFKVVTNIRQASVTDEIGIVCLEADGKRDEVKAAIKWLEKPGVSVEPVEISVIES
ncbi:MAG: NIL domain-containing protein [Verrucomicrobiota bacterium]